MQSLCLRNLRVGSVIVLDNAAFDKSQRTFDLIYEADCPPLFPSPYSLDLNPIEKLCANLK